MSRSRRPHAVLVPVFVSLVAAACGAAGPTPSIPSPTAGPPSEAPAPTPAPSAAPTATPSVEPLPTPIEVPTACLTLGDIDCARAAGLAKQTLLPTDPALVYVQVGPFACQEGDRCPTTLDSRPEGDVTLEFADATSATVHLVVRAGQVQSSREMGFGIPVEPSSQAGIAAGPQPYTLGHCGIFSGIDADGSWWDPVGPVDMDSGDAVNATEGILNLTDPTHGTFVAPSGFSIQLQRRDGAKVLPPCM
jgi:hypothetical protein